MTNERNTSSQTPLPAAATPKFDAASSVPASSPSDQIDQPVAKERRNRYPNRYLQSKSEPDSDTRIQNGNKRNGKKNKSERNGSKNRQVKTYETHSIANTGQDTIAFADVVSGAFDALTEEGKTTDTTALKRVLKPKPETPKLHKVLAQSGLGSRLEMEQLILEGRISVNNEPAHIGQRIQYRDQVRVNGKVLRLRIDPPVTRVLAYHKPAGEIVTMDDPKNRPTVFRGLPSLQQGKWQAVGRLDLNTEGLLLFSTSGELTNQLMHPRFGLEREYAVRILGALSVEEKQRLLEGIALKDGIAQFKNIDEGGGEGANCWYRVTITEGRNREVRRMFEALNHAVNRLIRIRYGAMMLPKGLRRGAWMELDEHDIAALCAAAGAAGMPNADKQRGERNIYSKNFRSKLTHSDEQGVKTQGDKQSKRGKGTNKSGGNNGASSGIRGKNPMSSIPSPLTPAAASVRIRGRNKSLGTSSTKSQGSKNQPDPMLTSVGYIGAESYQQQRNKPNAGRSGGGKRRF